MAKKNKNKKKNGGSGTKVGNVLRNVVTKAKAAPVVPGSNLKKPSLSNLKTLGVSASSLLGSALPGLNVARQVSTVKNTVSNTSKPVQKALPKTPSIPYNPNSRNMSVIPRARTSQFQTLNSVDDSSPMQTDDPTFGMYQTENPITQRGDGGSTSEGVMQSQPAPVRQSVGNQSSLVSSSGSSYGGSVLGASTVSKPKSTPSLGAASMSRSSISSPSASPTVINKVSGGSVIAPDGAENPLSDYNYSLSAEERAANEARKREQEYYKRQAEERVNRDQIMRDTLRQFQGEIDATNSVYADKIKQAQLQGLDRLGSTRAENFNAGAENSSFGNAANDRVMTFNRDQEGAILNEKLQMLSQIENSARELGDKYYQEKKAAKEAGLESYMESLKGAATAKEAIAAEIGYNILQSNLALEEIPTKKLDKIAKDAGVSVQKIKKFYEQARAEAEAAAFEQQLAEQEALRESQFNLSEGQARYDAQGNLIASRAKTYAPTTTGGVYGGISSKGQFGSDLDAIIGNTLATIGTKFGQEQFQAQVSRSRNDADKIATVASVVLKGAPAEVKRDFSNQAAAIKSIDKAIALLDEKTRTGVINNAKQYVFNVFGKDYDPNLAAVSSYITGAIQPYRNSVTGAAWGDQEDAEYASLFGSTKYSPTELKSRLTRVKEIMKDKSAQGLNVYVNPLDTYANPFVGGSQSPTDFSYLEDKIRIEGDKAYLSRSEWANVADKDALIAEAEADGYELLID
jgi:DNA-binding transcriptional MerR regulator